MSPIALLGFVLGYFLLLLWVAWRTSRRADNDSFFIGNRRSHWGLVAFGMVGTSLSGVTFISVPGTVTTGGFTYLQIVLGHVLGYLIVAFVLLPLYYRLALTSIYRYLAERFGSTSHRTGAGYFIVSRTLGATARLYLVVRVLQDMVLDRLGVPFWLTAAVIILMIVLYTYEGGVKTIVWTDTLQTAGMLAGLLICVGFLLWQLGLTPAGALAQMQQDGVATVFGTDPLGADFWAKQVLAGVFIAVAMTGLDQEMMQKNISVTTLRDAQKNVIVMSLVLLAVVALFLFLGGLLVQYAATVGLVASGDRLFPAVVLGHLPGWVQILFIVALISALFPSADGALTALTSSTCIDLIGLQQKAHWSEARRTRLRKQVHLGFALLFLLLVLGFRWLDDPSMVGLILKLAGYTYGPLLGLFAFGLLCRRQPREGWVPLVALAAPLLCALLDATQAHWLGGYRIGLELLLINAALTAAGLWLASLGRPPKRIQPVQPA
ncbi:sodium:solute symporter [Pseudorhodoferax sp.]|uniref:sodium:solute symporter n=1 Tax=Pseudorhodoferax sp. TaxID=1993553 RepID=UPI002DD63AB2|nr:sodium:solute symporter [Pseudorhodoferax sp.]